FGSYGPATFLLTAGAEGMGCIEVILANAWGIPVQVLRTEPIRVTRTATVPEERAAVAGLGAAATPTAPDASSEPTGPRQGRTPYTIRVVITPSGDRSGVELFTEDLGDTAGELVSLPSEMDAWLAAVREAPDQLPSEAAEALGSALFN